MKLALFGGSFNPLHIAHLQAAEIACNALSIDRLVFIPTACSPFKIGQEMAPSYLRLKWVQCAVSEYCKKKGLDWRVDPIELERENVSYTIDTVLEYKKKYSNIKLFLIIGMDHVSSLHRWKSADQLVNLVEFIILTRQNATVIQPAIHIRSHLVTELQSPISSSMIRQKIAQGQSVETLVPSCILDSVVKWYRKA